MKYDAKLDLHGYTLQNAYNLFAEFIEYCHTEKLKNVLIITGKGTGTSGQTINYEFPHWCESNMIEPYIRSYKHAEAIHGGNGAFYVRLRYD